MNRKDLARNPVLLPEHHIPDGEAHVMPDGKLYVYGSYDNQQDFYCSNIYRVASTEDMKAWEVHDIALRAEDIPWYNNPKAPHYPGVDWSRPTPFMRERMPDLVSDSPEEQTVKFRGMNIPALLYAPDCAYRAGKYYLYFCMSDESEGVAMSDKPTGPFLHPVQLPCGQIDPAVFVDEDGSAYYYWGQFRARGVRLNDDMVSFDETKVISNLVTEEEHFFHEGSSMRKIGDTYYFVFADVERGKPTALGYATGKTPLGPFTYRGIIIDNADCDSASWNNHGSIECVNGQWYVFYHRCSRGTQLYRRLCVEPIQILPDGTIPEVCMTSQGTGEPFGPGEIIRAFRACELHGSIYIAPEENGSEEALTHIGEGDSASFRYVRTDGVFHRAILEYNGKGNVRILLNHDTVGIAELSDEGRTEVLLSEKAQSSEPMELKLVFTNPQDLVIQTITLL